MHRGLDGVAQSSREPGEEGSGGQGAPGGPGRSGIWAPNLTSPNLESRTGEFWFIFISCLITFWSTNSGTEAHPSPRPEQSPVWDEIHSSSLFVGTRSPHLLYSPPITTHHPTLGKTMSNSPPIPHLGTRPAAPPP